MLCNKLMDGWKTINVDCQSSLKETQKKEHRTGNKKQLTIEYIQFKCISYTRF